MRRNETKKWVGIVICGMCYAYVMCNMCLSYVICHRERERACVCVRERGL